MGRSSPDYPGSEAHIAQTDVKPSTALLLCSGRIFCRLSKLYFFQATGQELYVQAKAVWASHAIFIMIIIIVVINQDNCWF